MVDRINPESNVELGNNLIPTALYVADNIEDLLNSRGRIIADAKEEYERIRDMHKPVRGLEGIIRRNFLVANPTTASSIFGMFRSEHTNVKAFIGVPTVRHDPAKDNRKHSKNITIFDARGEMEVELPDPFWSTVVKALGYRVLPADLLKKEMWASDVAIFADLNTENGRPRDQYFLIHAANRNLRGGKTIPTLLATLKAAGLTFSPDATGSVNSSVIYPF